MPPERYSISMPERTLPDPDGRRRVVVEAMTPEVDGGEYPAKRIAGEPVLVACDLLADGHDAVAGALLYRRLGGDGERGERAEGGTWEATIEAWIDSFATWRRGVAKKLEAGQPVSVEMREGAQLVASAAERARGTDAKLLREAAAQATDASVPEPKRFAVLGGDAIAAVMAKVPDLAAATRARPLRITADPPLARFSTWYELFPRSAGAPGKHGTLRDVAAKLPMLKEMGFDVLYLPPIHPIGRSFRKGKNNALVAEAGDVGSPWAIGSSEGGHKAVHPELGTVADLRALVTAARGHGIEIALDIAFQASPDHPYVKEHPEWFRKRADGTIQYAENPPKKYQDVYPFDFEGPAWESLWLELKSVITHWCEQGVRVFRVDNPHTKSLRFWAWCLAEVKAAYPEAIFLAEAFTRPKLMYALAKAGFSQSYTYFTWRHTKQELAEYMTELTRPPVSDFYRPNFWPNTPDILPEHLQFGGRPMFIQRLVLAATLASNYGIYGAPFELMEHVARPGSEEYLDNEKFQLRSWDLDREDSLRDVITLVNRIRRENPALQDNRIAFHPTDNPNLLCFSKRSANGENVVLVVVNLDAQHAHAGWTDLDLGALGIGANESYQVHDLLSESRYQWQGGRGYVAIDPGIIPASIFRIRRRVRSEHDFEYFL
jgi:starch synthase (maltosyl-transferring)